MKQHDYGPDVPCALAFFCTASDSTSVKVKTATVCSFISIMHVKKQS